MKTLLTLLLTCGWLCGTTHAADASGITAKIIPAQVRPGDLLELRVVMERPEYGRFTLEIPAQDHLHRVAIDRVPLKLEDGTYRQRETWWLQADASGNFSIDGGRVKLENENGVEEISLPPLSVEVLPYPAEDTISEPVPYPPDDMEASIHLSPWWWLLPASVLLATTGWWRSRPAKNNELIEAGPSLLESVLTQLDAGTVDAACLQQLAEQDISPELREEITGLVYGGRTDAGQLASALRKEATR